MSATVKISEFTYTDNISSNAEFPIVQNSTNYTTSISSIRTHMGITPYDLTTNIYSTSAIELLLTDSFRGYFILMTSDNIEESSYVSIPSGLATGFHCSVMQDGTATVNLSTGSGVSYKPSIASQIDGQYKAISIIQTSTDNYRIVGSII